ncbi:MAG: UDP-glucose 4-epimerase GalE [Fulvivirga sp.]
MSKAKILVTGGAGYIGSHTCVELIEAGYEPIIIDNFSNSERFVIDRINEITGKSVTLIEGDCGDEQLLIDTINKYNTTGVIHFAAYKAVGESSKLPLKYYRNNLGTTAAVLGAVEETSCKSLVFSSSCTVYGQPDKLPVTEKSPIKPAESPYGRTKQICEDMIGDFVSSGQEIKALALRYFNPIGAHPSALIGELPLGVPNNLIPFVTQTAAGIREKLTVFGNDYNTEDGTCIRDYIHVVDLAKAHVSAIKFLLESQNPVYDKINIGTGNGNSVLEVVKAFETANSIKLNYEIGQRRAGDVEKVYADAAYARQVLGWEANKSLTQSLKDAWNWQKTLK